MAIWSTLWGVIKNLLPFLKSAAQKFYEGLPEKTKTILLDSSKLGEVLKQTYKQSYDMFIVQAMEQLGFDKKKADEIIAEIAKSLNIDLAAPDIMFEKIQEYLNKIKENDVWNNALNTISSFVALYLSEGRLKLSTLMYGIMKWVYDSYLKGKK